MSDPGELLRALSETLTLDPIDVQLAGVLTRRANATGDRAIALALGAAFTSRAVREGHSAITIAHATYASGAAPPRPITANAGSEKIPLPTV